ncbi:alpha/beta fold hydrolase [Palleronia sp. KMU-117]|uniref:alpha/beta fold hydrolase n=1 Tax=Palleronia sp. KMU-117 TaxID=3434108 RepID=UPI003D710C5A
MSTLQTFASLAVAVVALGGCGAAFDGRATRMEAEAEARFPPIGRIVEVDGRPVHVLVEGQGPDLVIIHGAGGNLRDYTFDFVDRVKDRYRVIVFDRPGHGFTAQTDPAYEAAFTRLAEGPEEQAAFLAKAAAQIGVRDPIVMGQSFGGAVALAWALNHDPAAVVVVSGVSHPWPGGLGPSYVIGGSAIGGAAVVPVVAAFPPNGSVDAILARIFAPQAVPEGYADHFGVPLSLRRSTLRANTRQVNTLRPHIVRMSERYPTLDLPVEIVHGTEDQIVPLAIHSEPLAERVPGANLLRLEGVGHMPHHADPKAVIAAIDRAAARAGLR